MARWKAACKGARFFSVISNVKGLSEMAAAFYSVSNDALMNRMPVKKFKHRLVRVAHPTLGSSGKAGCRVRHAHHFELHKGMMSLLPEQMWISSTGIRKQSRENICRHYVFFLRSDRSDWKARFVP